MSLAGKAEMDITTCEKHDLSEMDYSSDITSRAVKVLQEQANNEIETGEWEVIDGFGDVIWADLAADSPERV